MDDPRPDQYQPPLRWYSHAWRIAVCLLVSGLVWFPVAEAQADGHALMMAVDLGLGAASYVLVFFRRRWPFTVALVLALMTAVSGVAAGPGTLAAVSLATRRRLVPIVVSGVVAIAGGMVSVEAQAYASQ